MNIFDQALNETMSSIAVGKSSAVQHRVKLDGKINAVDEWDLRKHIQKNWTPLKGERFVSPCGNFRSLVIETGCVMLTTYPVTSGAVVYVERRGRLGSISGGYEQDS